MSKISITENQENGDNLLYVQSSMSELFTQSNSRVEFLFTSGRAVLNVDCPECYADILQMEICDRVAEIIVIGYKYSFFKKRVKIAGLSSEEKEILYTSLIAADLEDDKRYTFDRIKKSKELTIDGIYNFRLLPLQRKWEDVASYLPQCFLKSQLKEFICYLLENKRKRVYVDQGRVYDSHYRRLKRSSLYGEDRLNIIREVLLSNCGEVELNGSIPKEDEIYLKEYYKDKIRFSVDGYN